MQHIKRLRNPNTGEMQDNLFGAKYTKGVVSEVKGVNVTGGSAQNSAAAVALAAHQKHAHRRSRYTVRFDDGSEEAGIPAARIREDDSPAPARPVSEGVAAAVPEAVATEAVRVDAG